MDIATAYDITLPIGSSYAATTKATFYPTDGTSVTDCTTGEGPTSQAR